MTLLPSFAATEEALFLSKQNSVREERPVQRGVKRATRGTLNVEYLRRKIRNADRLPHREIVFNLFSDAQFTARITDVQAKGPHRLTCRGRIAEHPEGTFILSINNKSVAAVIRIPGYKEFKIQSAGDGTHVITEIDADELGECANDSGEDADELGLNTDTSADSDEADSDSTVNVDVMVVYTTNVLASVGGEEAAVAFIDSCMADLNQRLANSDVDVTCTLVHQTVVDYEQSGDSYTDRERLSEPADGYMDEIHDDREQYAADLVCLLVTDLEGTTTGRAFIGGEYSVVLESAALANGTFAHEIGHNFGGGHDSTDGIYDFSHGYNFTGTNGVAYRTTMSRLSSSTRIEYFSNPDIEYMGVATGTETNSASPAHNAQTIRLYAPTVASFMDADTDGDGMPDSWEDLYGLDPADSSDASEDPDLDYLSNLQEYQNGLNPTNSDYDGDSLLDGWELQYGTDPFSVVDTAQEITLTWIASSNTPGSGSSYGVWADTNYLYVADGVSGLIVYAWSDPSNITRLDDYNTSGNAYDLRVMGSYAYIADGAYGLQVLNISNPSNILRVGSTDSVSSVSYDGFIDGDYLYRADYTQGLRVIDISVPTNPVIVGSLDTTGLARNVWVEDGYAYVADTASKLQIIDVNNPTNPVHVGNYADMSGSAYDVTVRSNIAYIARGNGGIEIADVSDPTNPSTLGYYDLSGISYSLFLDGNYAYVGDVSYGLRVFDISDPTDPTIVGSCNVGTRFEDIQVIGDLVVIADYTNGFHIIRNDGVPDSDLDGMLDSWELTWFGNLDQTATGDVDGDGLYNWGEYQAGLDPTIADSDNDGSSDGAEIIAGSDPADIDSTFEVQETLTDTGTAGFILTWPSQTNRAYSVFVASNLLDVFTALSTNIAATPPLNTFTDDTERAGAIFYRLDIDR